MTVTKNGREVEVTTVGQLIEELKKFDKDYPVVSGGQIVDQVKLASRSERLSEVNPAVAIRFF